MLDPALTGQPAADTVPAVSAAAAHDRHSAAQFSHSASARRIGDLGDTAVSLATRIHARLARGIFLVYADEAGVVYMDRPECIDGVPAERIAGTFAQGSGTFAALVEDLRCLRNLRMKEAMARDECAAGCSRPR